MDKCCGNCMNWDKLNSTWSSEDGGIWLAACDCSSRPPSTTYTRFDDVCKHHEEDESIEG